MSFVRYSCLVKANIFKTPCPRFVNQVFCYKFVVSNEPDEIIRVVFSDFTKAPFRATADILYLSPPGCVVISDSVHFINEKYLLTTHLFFFFKEKKFKIIFKNITLGSLSHIFITDKVHRVQYKLSMFFTGFDLFIKMICINKYISIYTWQIMRWLPEQILRSADGSVTTLGFEIMLKSHI